MLDYSTGGSGDLLHPVEGGSGLEPVDLLLVEGVVQEDGVGGPVTVIQDTAELAPGGEGLETNDGDLVIWPHKVIVCLVVEGERQHTLLLQIGLMNSKSCV